MLVDVYKPHVSGITKYIELNKRYLEKLGHDVHIFTFGEGETIGSESRVYHSPGLPLVDTGYYVSFRYTQEVQNVLHTMDLVHVHHPFLSGRLALRYCKPRNIPIIFTNHTRYDLYAKAYIPALPDGVGESFLKAYLPSFCHDVNMVIAPSPGLKSVLENLGVDVPIEVIPNGVDLSAFRGEIQAVDRTEIGFHHEDVLFIYAGRLGPEKNLPFLLRSFKGAAQAYDNIGLIIVGDGPERDNLEDRVRYMKIHDRIHFTGMVPYNRVANYLVMGDVFATASVTEVHPLSVIEAMAAGLPVLGIDSPGVGDTIEDSVSGLISPEEDLAMFTAKMVRMISDQELRREMGVQARETSNNYAIENTTRIMEALYEEVVSQSIRRKRTLRARISQFVGRWRN
ncbi:MAG: glycosyltransferase [Anaerolineales bacterium]|jgi:glycosyltransferase involved in cell wall biosynthesis